MTRAMSTYVAISFIIFVFPLTDGYEFDDKKEDIHELVCSYYSFVIENTLQDKSCYLFHRLS